MENKEENYGNIEVTTLISKLQIRCIIAHGFSTHPLYITTTMLQRAFGFQTMSKRYNNTAQIQSVFREK